MASPVTSGNAGLIAFIALGAGSPNWVYCLEVRSVQSLKAPIVEGIGRSRAEELECETRKSGSL